jgi:AraC-like DNA-binding protein
MRTPLRRFPLIDTRNPDDMRDMLVCAFGTRGFDLQRNEPEFRGVTNHVRLGGLDLTFWACSTASRSVLPEVDMIKQQFVLRGSGETSFGHTTFEISRSRSGVVPAGTEMTYENEDGFAEYVLRIDATALRTKLGAMTGIEVAQPIEFEATSDFDHPEQARLRRLIDHVVGELDDDTTDLPPQALAQYEQSLIVCFLYGGRHNFSHLLERRQPRPAPWQVRRAEEYIEANGELPLTLEALANVTETSGLAVSDGLQATRGASPLVLLKQIRLNHARRLLRAPEEDTSVAATARRFGFFNAAEFARDYRRTFGEPPSATLAAARRKRG